MAKQENSASPYIKQAITEYQTKTAWWQNGRPKAPLPESLERLLERNDPAFIDKVLEFAVLQQGSYEYWSRSESRYKRIEWNEEGADGIDDKDGSWIWTLYLKDHPLAKAAVYELLKPRSHMRWVDRLFKDQTEDQYGWLRGNFAERWRGIGYRHMLVRSDAKYFRYIKAIYKRAEMERDIPTWAILAYRFDVAKNFYYSFRIDDEQPSAGIYSPKTHHYLRRRSWRTLRRLGEAGSSDYVDMAAKVLLEYRDDDGMVRRYFDPETQQRSFFRDFTRLWLFNHILYHNSKRFVYKGSQTWKMVGSPMEIPEEREEAFPELWDRHPEKLWELFMKAQSEPVLQFTIRALKSGNRAYLEGISLEELKKGLHDSYGVRKRWIVKLILERMARSGNTPAKLSLWFSYSTSEDYDVRRAAWDFMREYGRQFSDEQRVFLIEKFIHTLMKAEVYWYIGEEWVSYLEEILLPPVSRFASFEKINHLLACEGEAYYPKTRAIRKLGALMLSRVNPVHHPFTGRDLLPFLQAENPEIREAARQVLHEHFTKLELDADFLAEFASIPGDDHQVFVTQFFADRILWLVPFLPELIQKLWVRMLDKNVSDEVRDYIRDHLLGSLFFHELGQTSLEKILRLLSNDEVKLQEFGARLFQLVKPGPDELTPAMLLAFAHSPLVSAREEARKIIAKTPSIQTPDFLVNLAETEWDDTREWTLQIIRERKEINPDLIYGLLDTARTDIQQFAMELVSKHEERLDLIELMLRASEHPDLNVQEYALTLAVKVKWTPERLKRTELFFRTVLFRVHQGRKAKQQALKLLLDLGVSSKEMAEIIVPLLSDLSRNFGKKDFERILLALTRIQTRYPDLKTPLVLV